MTLEELVGAQLAVGLPGPEVTDDVLACLRRLHVQSVVVFSRNFTSVEQFTGLRRRLCQALGREPILMVDHEGGRIIRFSSGVTRFPDALSLGRARDVAAIERQGEVEAGELRRLGIGVNLAPCADVLVDGSDPIIGDRAYGSDPALVSACAAARIRGLQTHRVAACAKHFPGLGAVPRDPHRILPTIRLTRDAMERVHVVPFQEAIRAGVAMVMSSHVCYPGLGEPDGLPATFSPRLIQGWLRDRLGFQGLILTDDLEMGALRTLGSIGQAAVKSVKAGHDLLLICSNLALVDQAAIELHKSYNNKELDIGKLEETSRKLARLRQVFSLDSLECPP